MNTSVFSYYYEKAVRKIALMQILKPADEGIDAQAERETTLARFNALIDRMDTGDKADSIRLFDDDDNVIGYARYCPFLNDLGYFYHADRLPEKEENRLFGERLEKVSAMAKVSQYTDLEKCFAEMEKALLGIDRKVVSVSRYEEEYAKKTDKPFASRDIATALNEGRDTGYRIVSVDGLGNYNIESIGDTVSDRHFSLDELGMDVSMSVDKAIRDEYEEIMWAYDNAHAGLVIDKHDVSASQISTNSHYELDNLYAVIDCKDKYMELLVRLPILKVKDLADTGEYPEYMTYGEVYKAVRENGMFVFHVREVDFDDGETEISRVPCFEKVADNDEVLWRMLTDGGELTNDQTYVTIHNLKLTEIGGEKVNNKDKPLDISKMKTITAQDLDAIGYQGIQQRLNKDR